MRSGTGAMVIQNRGGKTKYGGITRDPLIHMKQKLSKQNQRKHAKIPLVSEERKQSLITLPVKTTSLSKQKNFTVDIMFSETMNIAVVL